MMEVAIAVIGAGPAGLTAAIEAANLGCEVVVLDEYSQPGGQYYRQPASGLKYAGQAKAPETVGEGAALVEEARRAGVNFLNDAFVWGTFGDGSIAVHVAGRSDVIMPSRLIVAAGAHERPVAFPGWTLPGVITAGAAQALLKGQGVLPGRRILMAGSGPLQVAVAAQLVEAGGHLVEVLEAGKFGGLFTSGPRFWGQWGRMGEGIQYYRTLRSAKVPLNFGRTVIRANAGDDGTLASVVVADLDGDWSPVPGRETTLEVDTLCLGFGLIPSTKLTRLLGCQITYDPTRGGHVPVVDDVMQTTRPGVFVAGESAGIGGAKVAELQGRIAGITAAVQLGKTVSNEARKRIEGLQRELKRELRFAASLNETFAPRHGLLALLTDDTVICRCEEVTVGQIRKDRPEWYVTLDAVRTVLRVGMGDCQGSMCETLVAQLLAMETGKGVDQVGTYHIRPPLKPIPTGALADLSSRLLKQATVE